MIRSFWFVTTRSFRNRMLQRLRKLRSPRYAISLVAGLAYMWFFIFRRAVAGGISSGQVTVGLPASDIAVDIVSCLAFAGLLLVWALPDSGGGLSFSEAEVQFLFPAPLTRRDLLTYKIFRQQIPLLISAMMVTLLGFRHSRFVGVWLAFVVLSIYFTLASLGRARLKAAHIGFVARLIAVTIIAVGAATLIVNDIHNPFVNAPEPKNSAELEAMLQSAGSVFHNPFVRALLFVPRIFALAVFPKSPVLLLVSCAALVVLGFVFYEIAARLNVSFEEASAEAAVKRTSLRATVFSRRAGNAMIFRRFRLPWHLSGKSGPEIAIAWKNLTAALRTSLAWVIMIVVLFGAFAVDAAIMHGSRMHMGIAALSLMLCAVFPFMASGLLRQDLRLDLPRVELLKSYPISGERLVLAELAAPVLIMSAMELILLSGTATLTNIGGDRSALARLITPEFIVIALLFAIPICAMQLLIYNAVAILLPGWVMQAPDEQRGFAVMGQRLVILGGNLIVLVIGLIPAAIIFVPTFLIAHKYFQGSPIFLAVGTVPSIAVLVAELWAAVHFLGTQFEQIDVSGEMGTTAI